MQEKAAGRATVTGNATRDGTTSVRLHTEPGDNNVDGSGDMERNDLWITAADSDCLAPENPEATSPCEGHEQWWAHSILFPDDFAIPKWHMYVVADFHHSGPTGQANFQINFQQRPNDAEYGDLVFNGYGGTQDANHYRSTIAPGGSSAPIDKNVWYDFVYHVKWSSGSNGYFDAWVRKGNGSSYKRVLARQGPTLYEHQGAYFKLANYHTPVCDPYNPAVNAAYPANPYHCAHPANPQQPPSSVIHDRVVRGTDWTDVVMASPSGTLEGQHEENAATYGTPASWTTYPNSGYGTFSGGTMAASNVASQTMTFNFTGTAVTWMGVKCNLCGIATIALDGGTPIAVDTLGTDGLPNLKATGIYTFSGLSLGSHTIVVTVTGTHSTGSTDNYVAADGFWVLPIAPTPLF